MKTLKTLAFLSLTIILLSGISATFAQTIWTGNTNTDWSTASNWNPSFAPSDVDDVIIPAGITNYPVLNFGQRIKSLTIESGATMTQNSGVLRIEGGASSISGTFNQASGILYTDHLTISGSYTQDGGILFTDNLSVNIGGLLSIGNNTGSGQTLDVSGNFKNYSTVNLNGGDVTLRGSVDNFIDGNLSIAGATTTSLGHDVKNKGSMSISSGSLLLKKADGSEVDKILEIDGGVFTQTGGTVTVKDLEIKNGGIYNQSDGELNVSHDFKCDVGNTFSATGGTVHFIGEAGGGGKYKGDIQFFNVLIDDGADPKFNNDGDHVTIKIAGNFENNNADMHKVDKTTFIFNGTGDQTIYSAMVPTPDDYKETTFGTLIIDKPSGALTLLSDISVDDVFTPTQGYLDLNGYVLYVNGEIYDGPLPVELSSFSAINLENGVRLSWKTETEVSNYGFDIERTLSSSHNLIWEKIGFVEGHGNSNSPKDYSFVDANIAAEKYSYRLKQIDTDGKFEYSKVIEVDLGSAMNYELSQNYPNPFNPSTTIRFSVSESSFINLSIFNALGEKIEELVNEDKEPGVHTIEFFAQNLPSGTYFYTINSNDYTNTKKMILVK